MGEITRDEMKNVTRETDHDRVLELNHRNDLLESRVSERSHYARLHKRIWERRDISKRGRKFMTHFPDVKKQADEKVLSVEMLDNDGSGNY